MFIVIWRGNTAAEGIQKRFRIASYNVENLFDLYNDGTEYSEYVPGTKLSWDKKTAAIKYSNISKVIAGIDADIVALQEVESRSALDELVRFLEYRGAEYPFSTIADRSNSSVKCALLSKFRITDSSEIKPVQAKRSILKVRVDISGNELVVYVNHWSSKKYPESSRIEYARILKKDVKKLHSGAEYIITGDLNSNFNEFITILTDRKLNDTAGKTGINHILNTISASKLNDRETINHPGCFECLYNLWLEMEPLNRWSYIYKKKKGSLDNIIVPYTLLNGDGIDYIEDTFGKYVPGYLFRGDKIFRWQMTKKGYHKGRGFSDHLPVYADFTIESE